jgi:hypothetical protein
MTDHRPVGIHYDKSPIHPAYSSVRTRPDWVIVGSPYDNGEVMLIASKSLTSGELVHETDYETLYSESYFSPLAHVMTSQEYRLEVRMRPDSTGKVFIMITAPTYGQALKHLLEHWRPGREGDEDEDSDDRPALDPGPSA